MERRAHERVTTILPVKYYCEDDCYTGTVHNVSEQGMFICTGNFLPCTNCLEIHLPMNKEILCCTAEIRRIEKINDSNYTMGIELVTPPDAYLKFVDSLKT
jgi:hypothetical protein